MTCVKNNREEANKERVRARGGGGGGGGGALGWGESFWGQM
jgi:hypothetical protein